VKGLKLGIPKEYFGDGIDPGVRAQVEKTIQSLAAQGAELVVSQLVKLAEAGVERVAANANRFEEKTGLNTLNTIAEVTKPGAVVLSELAANIEAKSAALASNLAGNNITTASVKRPSAFSQRRGARAA